MALGMRVFAGGSFNPLNEAQVEDIGGRKVFWRGILYSPSFEPYLVVFSEKQLPERGFFSFKGELVFYQNKPVLISEESYWGLNVGFTWFTAQVVKTVKRGQVYLVRAGWTYLTFYQESGIPLQEGEHYFLEGDLRIERKNQKWNVEVRNGKVIC